MCEHIRHFFNNVMIRLGYHGWELEVRNSHDSYCWIRAKKITLGILYEGDIRQILLHEIAHIDTARFCNQKHNMTFWNRLEDLVRRFLKCELDGHQLRHKKTTEFGGFYRVEYDNNHYHSLASVPSTSTATTTILAGFPHLLIYLTNSS